MAEAVPKLKSARYSTRLVFSGDLLFRLAMAETFWTAVWSLFLLRCSSFRSLLADASFDPT